MRRGALQTCRDPRDYARRARCCRGGARLCRRGARNSRRADRRHDRRWRSVRGWLPCGPLSGAPARGLPRDRSDRGCRSDFAFWREARRGLKGARRPVNNVRRLAVYCGSASGSSEVFAAATRATAKAMAGRGVDLVYGGGRLGLMGLIADSVLAGGGRVYGVIPQALVDIEVAHLGLTELHTVGTMRERKAKMTSLADEF